MRPALVGLLVVAVASAALVEAGLSSAPQGTQTFTGVITDDMCPTGSHAHMRMGPTDAECAKACIMSHAARYVLYDGKSAYVLSDQKTPEQFAAQKVRVVRTLAEKSTTTRVEPITPAR
jgi:hypothetical protein